MLRKQPEDQWSCKRSPEICYIYQSCLNIMVYSFGVIFFQNDQFSDHLQFSERFSLQMTRFSFRTSVEAIDSQGVAKFDPRGMDGAIYEGGSRSSVIGVILRQKDLTGW